MHAYLHDVGGNVAIGFRQGLNLSTTTRGPCYFPQVIAEYPDDIFLTSFFHIADTDDLVVHHGNQLHQSADATTAASLPQRFLLGGIQPATVDDQADDSSSLSSSLRSL